MDLNIPFQTTIKTNSKMTQILCRSRLHNTHLLQMLQLFKTLSRIIRTSINNNNNNMLISPPPLL